MKRDYIEERKKLLNQLVALMDAHGDTLDWDDLRRRAAEEGLSDALADLERMPRQQSGKTRWQEALESGKLVKLGPRRYRYNVGPPPYKQ